MPNYGLCVLVCVTILSLAAFRVDAADVFQPDVATLDRLAAKLPRLPDGLGPRASDRKAWQSIADRPEAREAVQRAEALLQEPMPDLPDDLYLDYSRTGNRRRCEAVLGQRHNRIPVLALAECIEGKGRFLPKLEEAIQAVCAEKSWVLPAHDGNLQTFTGKLITIDLASSVLGWTMGTVDYLLGDRLRPEVRAQLRAELDKRIFRPYHRMCAGEQNQYWLLYRMNWNSVCLAGVTGAALTAVDDPRERAWYALAAEHYSRYALEGFSPDGFCDEGVGYWNYGFGHYAAMAETVRRATNGLVDLMNRKEALMPSAYGFQIEIVPGICPAFADCDVKSSPAPGILDYLSRRFTGRAILRRRRPITGDLCNQVMALFPARAPVVRTTVAWPSFDPLRTWFPEHSVLIGRSAKGSSCRLSVALMGGHNAQNHNHNDVGTYMVLVDRTVVLADIGAEVYTRRTFSAQRYESKALNSWGHPVPVIGGQLQRSGRNAEARVLSKSFSAGQDRISMDIRSAYGLPEVKKLERSFTYDRTGAGRFTVSDDFEFDQPLTYETALLTFGTWEKVDATTLRVREGDAAVRVSIQTPAGMTPVLTAEEVREDLTARRTATRIGIALPQPVARGEVTLIIAPDDEVHGK